jgi:asparagine synthase (glutamine-hydrolysing)
MVAAMHPNLDHVLIEGPGIWDFDALDRYGRSFGMPLGPCHNAGWINLLHLRARSHGVRVMLTGGMGNMTISYDGYDRLGSLLRRGRLGELAREWMAGRSVGRSYQNLLRLTFSPLLPGGVWNSVLLLRGQRQPVTVELSMLRPALLPQARSTVHADSGRHRMTRRDILPRLCRRGEEAALGYMLGAWDIEARDPTIDKRIVEYCYAIPGKQFFLRGQPRRLLRRAMTGTLPNTILDEKRRGRQAADWCEAAAKARPQLLDEIDRLSRYGPTSTIFDVQKMRKIAQSLAPARIAADPHIAFDYNHLLIAITAGRFIRRALGKNI